MPLPKVYFKAASRQHLENHYSYELHMQLCLLLSNPLCEAKIFQTAILLLGYSSVLGYGDRKTLHMFKKKTLLIQTSALSVTE